MTALAAAHRCPCCKVNDLNDAGVCFHCDKPCTREPDKCIACRAIRDAKAES